MDNNILFTPGPLMLDERVKGAMYADLGSRDPAFKKITRDMLSKVGHIVGSETNNLAVIPLPGSGSTMIEAAFINLVRDEDRVLICENGIYGVRAKQIASSLGINYKTICSDMSQPFSTDKLKAELNSNSYTYVFFVQSETTTGVLNPFEEIISICHSKRTKVIVDAISGIGGTCLNIEKYCPEALIFTPNKCIEGPPGISFIAIKRDLLEVKNAKVNSFTFRLLSHLELLEDRSEWRFTPPTHVVQGVDKALDIFLEEGLSNRIKRYKATQNEIKRVLGEHGLSSLVNEVNQGPACLAMTSPKILTHFQFRNFYNYLQERHISIYSLFEPCLGFFRVGTVGAIHEAHVKYFLDSVIDYHSKMEAPHMEETHEY